MLSQLELMADTMKNALPFTFFAASMDLAWWSFGRYFPLYAVASNARRAFCLRPILKQSTISMWSPGPTYAGNTTSLPV